MFLSIADLPSEISESLDKAKNGDVESQFKVGQYYLKLADTSDEKQRQEYGKTAIHWLVEASRQGDDNATDELRTCLDNETGIIVTVE